MVEDKRLINFFKKKEDLGDYSTNLQTLTKKIEKFQVDITRLAQGVPIGGEVHYLDENTLNTAFQARKKIT